MKTTWWAVLLLGLSVGGLSGVLGIGGGVFLIPGLMYLFHFSQLQAQGTTLAALVPPIGLFAAISYYRQGNVDISSALWLAVGFSIGAFITAGFVHRIPADLLSQIFGGLLLFIGARMIFHSDRAASIMASAVAVMAVTWATFLLAKIMGHRRGIAPKLSRTLDRLQTQSPRDSDYQI